MCFSAPVSFVAGGVLTTAGVTLYTKAKKNLKYIAAIPLLFGIQQFIEWMQWLAIADGVANMPLAYLYLFFAFLLWPIYIPLSVYLNEPQANIRQVLIPFVFAGTMISTFLLSMLLTEPLSVNVVGKSLQYEIRLFADYFGSIIYVFVTVGSLLLSSIKYLKVFGVFGLASAAISWVIYSYAFTSVWCFFAALLSFLIYFNMNKIK